MMRTATAIAAVLLLAACTTPPPAQTPVTETVAPAEAVPEAIADESARLNTWFEAKFLETVARSPMTQTYLGIKDDYGQWDDVSDAHALGDLELQRAIVAEMKATFEYDRLDPQAKLSWRLAEYELSQAEAAFPFRDHAYVFNQMFGVQSGIPAFLVNQHKVASLSDAEAYISRLEGIPAYLGQNVANAQASAAKGILPPRFVYDYVLSDSRGVITGYPFVDEGEDSPLLEDFRKKVTALVDAETITQDEAETLLARAADALRDGVGPAYEAAIVELEAQTSVATTDDGAWKLPDADAYYAMRLKQITTTVMTADEIHELGLAEVARIQNEMRGIMKQVGFDGTLEEFFEFTRTDPQFFKPNTDEGRSEYLTEATAAIDAMREDLPTVFKTFPKADLIVKAVEPFREQSAGKAFYSRPAPDGSRPGTYYANLYRMQDMPTYQLQALAFHEGIPGHHMQIAMAQELEGIPSFRKYGGYTAYTEGWGLYSELLPKEMGYYSDPYDDFGRLDCQKAIDRYIVMPGQATAYKIGMLKIVDLREMAKAELGDAFDIRDFHDVVLRDGAVPLAILEQSVLAWAEETKEN